MKEDLLHFAVGDGELQRSEWRLTAKEDQFRTAIQLAPFDLYPALRIQLDPGEAVLDLTRREADLALRVVRPTRGIWW